MCNYLPFWMLLQSRMNRLSSTGDKCFGFQVCDISNEQLTEDEQEKLANRIKKIKL